MTDQRGAEPAAVVAAKSDARQVLRADEVRDTELPAYLRNLPEKDHEQDIRLKRTYALALLIALGIQLLIADGVFIAFAWAGVDWNLSPVVIDVWLAATVVQVIGVVLVVTRYLFPQRDSKPT